eukprot:scaffold2157_cov376-Prasinococcus_capsulatus_cf.AAC.7
MGRACGLASPRCVICCNQRGSRAAALTADVVEDADAGADAGATRAKSAASRERATGASTSSRGLREGLCRRRRRGPTCVGGQSCAWACNLVKGDMAQPEEFEVTQFLAIAAGMLLLVLSTSVYMTFRREEPVGPAPTGRGKKMA